MSNQKTNPVLMFIYFSVLCLSLYFVMIVLLNTGVIFQAESPSIKYSRTAAEIYLRTNDFRIINILEDRIEMKDLDKDTQDLFLAKVYDNFIRNPRNYSESSEILSIMFNSRSSDIMNIIFNRNNYVISDTIQLDSSKNLEEVKAYLDNIEKYSHNISNMMSDKDWDSEKIASEKHNLDLALEKYKNSFIDDTYILFKPRYEYIIYSIFLISRNQRLVNTAKDIIKDKKEDPILRVIASKYLVNISRSYNDSSIVKFFDEVITEGEINGYFDSSLYDTNQQIVFRQKLLDMYHDTVLITDNMEKLPTSTPNR